VRRRTFVVSIERISAASSTVLRFAETREGEVKRLQGPLGAEFRLRSRNLRIRFLIESDGIIVILRVLPRDKAYR